MLTHYLQKLWLTSALALLVSSAAIAQEAPPPPRPDNLQTDEPADAAAPDMQDVIEGEAVADAVLEPDDGKDAPLTFGLAGPYLAARIASVENDFMAAARYFRQAVAHDPDDLYLQDSALVSMISAGQIDEAAELARKMAAAEDGGTELAGLVLRADLAKAEEWAGLLTLIQAAQPNSQAAPQGGQLLDGMLAAWAKLGAGNATEALADFERLRRVPGAAGMLDYQLAMARALVGDYEGAEQLLSSGAAGHLQGDLAHAQVLAQLDRRDEALAVLDGMPGNGSEPSVAALQAALENGEEVSFDVVASPRQGIAQVFLTFATALANAPEPEPLALIHARLSGWIAPELGDARLVTAQILQMHDQFDLAEAEYEALRNLGEVRPVAELTRIDALARAKRYDEAEKVALALTATYPDLAQAWIAQGDLLRQQDKFGAAVPAYDKALSLIDEADGDARWFPLYARGIALERSGQFDRAEADLKAALEIRPEQPSLLNYLGYSWIDRGENLDEALTLIQKAVELSPEDGYIQDSLAWAYFRLGRYAEAVAPMEQAARTMSVDPLINDHLGDIYWMVGRKREAEIQWHRALSLKPTETEDDVDPDRIRAKLERGLDAVMAEEGSPPAPHRPAAPSDSADNGSADDATRSE
ncbi:tetratricopeptide repeat protein [Paracoccus sp. M683]|uniref:tetratricopeptide repeat protein n=1 Tax=Paracoccus sp. M683 TaxID=2594268 RepID=UPI00351A1DF0